MKRHLLILAPVSVFALFVGCNGGDEPLPPIANLPKTSVEVKVADCNLQMAMNSCRDSMQDILPILLMNQGNGQGAGNAALLAMAFKKPKPYSIDGIPDRGSCQQKRHEGNCNDNLITAMMLIKSAPLKDGNVAYNDPYYKRYFDLRMRNYLIQNGRQFGLSPIQQIQMGGTLQQALGQSGAFNAADVAFVNSAFAAQGTSGGMTLGSNPNGGGMTLGANPNTGGMTLNNQAYYPSTATNAGYANTTSGTSTSLNLGVRRGIAADSQTVGSSELSAARGFGLPSTAGRLNP